uniref:Uncharacterized protein n=1 Tax=Anguilla anguilla TaxID=7936 RepID=A0A0E9TSW2_ANGAN
MCLVFSACMNVFLKLLPLSGSHPTHLPAFTDSTRSCHSGV